MTRKVKGLLACAGGALLLLVGAIASIQLIGLLLVTIGVALGGLGLSWLVDPFDGGDEFIPTPSGLLHHTTETCHRR